MSDIDIEQISVEDPCPVFLVMQGIPTTNYETEFIEEEFVCYEMEGELY